jgi:molybdopterin molybdotransferase
MLNMALLSTTDALQKILEQIEIIQAESIPLSHCLGRVLREDIKLRMDLPPFDRSAMDGYALAGQADDNTYKLVGTLAAGTTETLTIQPGECARILTGAPLPQGSDRIAIQEECEVQNSIVKVKASPKTGDHIRYKGEDGHQGDVVVSQLCNIGPTEIGIAASIGRSELIVSKEPVVWILSTGNEIVDPGEELKPGQIYNSNAPQLAAQVTSFGGRPRLAGNLSDDVEKICKRIEQAIDHQANVICISGGASVGDADHTRTALEKCGFEIIFHGVDLKPGKPTLFAKKYQTLAFGIPGNPVSHLAVFGLFIGPALRALQGLPPQNFKGRLKHDWNGKKDSRNRWFPAIVEKSSDKIEISILLSKGSGDLVSCAGANALANIPAHLESAAKDSEITYHPLTAHI